MIHSSSTLHLRGLEGRRIDVTDPLFLGTEAQGDPGDGLPPGATRRFRDRPLQGGESQGLRLARILVLIATLGIVAIGLLVGGAGLLVALFSSAGDVQAIVTASLAFLVLSVGVGSGMAWQAGRAIAGLTSGRFQPRQIWIWVLVFAGAVILGQLALSVKLAALLAFPVLHILAAGLPPLIVLALMGRALGGVTRWREVVLETGSGAFLSTVLAFTFEFVAILGVALLGLAVVAVRPNGPELLQALATRLQDPAWLQNPENLAGLAASPIVVIGALLFVAGVIPVIEETVKTLGVGLLAYRRPSLPEAMLWGVASGAGFAMAEALFNSVGGLDGWSGIVLLRVGASMLHCLTGGLMGIAWYYLLVERRWERVLGLYAAAVSLHGLWNALATGMAWVSLLVADQGASSAGQRLVALASFGTLALLILLALGVAFGLVALARYARRHANASPRFAEHPADSLAAGEPQEAADRL
jgi:hypothetical protein